MKIVLFGGTGMVGQGVLRECLLDPDVTEVFAVTRSGIGQEHPKLRDVVHGDFENFADLNVDADACFWCLGVTSAGMKEEDYARITYGFTLAAANALVRTGAAMTFVFVSGTGADGNAMWARVKRRAEDALFAMPFKSVYVFRPGVIEPLHGIRSRTRMYNVLYPLLYPVMAVMKAISPRSITTTERVGQAMLRVAKKGFSKKILENLDINAAAAS